MFTKEIYTIIYIYLGKEYCQDIEAFSKTCAEELFFKHYDNLCKIISIDSIRDKSDKLSDALIEIVKKQFANHKNTLSKNGKSNYKTT